MFVLSNTKTKWLKLYDLNQQQLTKTISSLKEKLHKTGMFLFLFRNEFHGECNFRMVLETQVISTLR